MITNNLFWRSKFGNCVCWLTIIAQDDLPGSIFLVLTKKSLLLLCGLNRLENLCHLSFRCQVLCCIAPAYDKCKHTHTRDAADTNWHTFTLKNAERCTISIISCFTNAMVMPLLSGKFWEIPQRLATLVSIQKITIATTRVMVHVDRTFQLRRCWNCSFVSTIKSLPATYLDDG